MEQATSMRMVEFLGYLRSLDVHLTVEDGRLGCNAPKGVLTPELTAELKARKAEIIDFLRQTSERAFSQPIQRVSRQTEFIPSSSQQRLWFLDQFDTGKTAYNIAGGLRFRGALDKRAIERSLREILSRHEILRTSIVNVDGSPRAIIRSTPDWKLELHSLLETPEELREEELLNLAATQAGRRFHLESAPLIRACLVEVAPLDHALLVTMHHIAADGWSLSLLGQELAELYQAFAAGKPSPLGELPIQYSDYACWHKQSLESGVLQSEIPYWKKKLAGPLPVMDLPGDHPRALGAPSRGARSRQTLSTELLEAMRRFSLAENATPFATLLAAFKLLLFRYTRQADVVVGSATAGRNRPELEKLIGLFINNLVLRTDLSGDPTVTELVARVRDTALNASAHPNIPLDLLAEVLQPNRDLNRPPLFQVMFVMQNFPQMSLELAGLTITPFEVDTGSARFDLTVDVLEKGNQLELRWEYNADLFETETIARMQGHYARLLEGLIANPQARISGIPMMTPGEETCFRETLTGEERDSAGDVCIHELFEQQVVRSPESAAVVCGSDALTYRELNVRANRLANQLRSMGVGPESVVAVCLEPSIGMVVTLLGVLKAGGAYVPLDPEYPQSRLAFMLEDSRASVLVSQNHLLPSLPGTGIRVLCLDGAEGFLEHEGEQSRVRVSAESLAYVIYTSGSTGKPKGVAVTHRSVVNLLASMQREPGMKESDRLLAVTTLSFDIAGLEIFLPLISGARIIVAPRTVAADGVALSNLLSESRATIMQATPATWRLLLESGWDGAPGLKILCGGEALPRELADRLLDTGSDVWNLYGPTETTIWSTIHRVVRHAGPVPIGRPIANTQAYVLDEFGQPVPQGVPGELFLGGAGLARGYLRRPELTQERFVSNPFRPGEKLYRTGDLVLWRPGSGLEYIARLDHQVKLRGFRIELGEIETALLEQPGVREAAVIIREEAPGDQKLVAYVVMRERGGDAHQIRESLLSRLPDYMVPARFVFLDALPLTPNRKLDRSALPAPTGPTEVSALYVPPRTDREREVAAIWADLLKQERIGVNDNFFDLGGHSLLAVQLQNRLMRHFHSEISIVELFQRPTVSAIASLLASKTEAAVQA